MANSRDSFFRALPLLCASSVTGCLSVNNVPQVAHEQPDSGPEVPGDGGVRGPDTGSTSSTSPDGKTTSPPPEGTNGGGSGTSEAKCADQGPIAYGEFTYQGKRSFCAGSTTCGADSVCVAPAECAPGVTTACTFHPSGAHGRMLNAALDGDYLYWIESGTFDQLNNYSNDGAIARAKIGDWTREELVGGLSLSSQGTLVNTNLRVEGTHGFVRLGGWSYQFPTSMGAKLTVDEVDQSYWLPCLDGATQYWFHFWPNEARRRTLGETSPGELIVEGADYGTHALSCVVMDGYLYGGTSRVALAQSARETLSEDVVGRFGDKLVAFRTVLDKLYLALGKQGTAGDLGWQNIAELPTYHSADEKAYGKVAGRFFYWMQRLSNGERVVVRAALDGSTDKPEIIDYGDAWQIYPLASALVWIESLPEDRLPAIHYLPVSP